MTAHSSPPQVSTSLPPVVVMVEDIPRRLEIRNALTRWLGAAPGLAPETLREALARDTQAPVLAVVPGAVADLAAELARDLDPAAALERWRVTRATLAADHRLARRRVTLVDAALFETGDPAPWAKVAERLGRAPTGPLPRLRPGPRPAPLLLVAATALIAQDPEATALAETLTAATLGGAQEIADAALVGRVLAEATAAASEQDLLRQALSLHAGAEDGLRARLAETRASAAMTRDDLAAVQTALDEEHRTADLLRDSLSLHLDHGAALQSLVTTLRHRLDRQSEDIRDLHLLRATVAALEQRVVRAGADRHSQIATLGARLLQDAAQARRAADAAAARESALTRTNATLEAELAALRAEATANARRLAASATRIAALQGELDRVYGSRSWRVTGPFRAARQHLRPGHP